MAPRRWPLITLVCHVLVLAVLVALYAVTVATTPRWDASIGGGMLLFGGVGALGLPWSLLVIFGVLRTNPQEYETVQLIAFALLNLSLHGLVALYLARRRPALQGVGQEDLGRLTILDWYQQRRL